MASNRTFPTVLALFSLAAMLATGCGSKGHTGDTGARQGSSSCWMDHGSDTESCASTYGALALLPAQDKTNCEILGGEWSDEACPDGFWGWCDHEIIPDSGIETYHYGSFDPYAEGACEIVGAGSGFEGTTWHE